MPDTDEADPRHRHDSGERDVLESVEVPDVPEYMLPDRPPRVTVRFGKARASQSASSLRGPPSSQEAAPVLLPRIRSPTLVRFGRSNTAPVAAVDGAPPPPPARLDKKSLSAPSSVASSSSQRSSSDADDDDADFAAPPPARRPRLHGTEEVHSLVTAGNRIKFIDSVDFLLDGLRGGQPPSVRHSSALSLLDKCADADFVLDFVATDLVRGVLRLLQASPDAVMDAATVAFVARVLAHKPAVEALASEYEFLRLLACWLDGAEPASPSPAKHANSLQVALGHAAVALSFGETAATPLLVEFVCGARCAEAMLAKPTAALQQSLQSAGVLTALLGAVGRLLDLPAGELCALTPPHRAAAVSSFRALESLMFQNEGAQRAATQRPALLERGFAHLSALLAAVGDVEQHASALLASLVALLVNITNENADACRQVGADVARLQVGVRSVLATEGEFDCHVQSIALMVNLIEHDRANRSCVWSLAVGEEDRRELTALKALAELYRRHRDMPGQTTEDSVRLAYQALLLACTVDGCPNNEHVLTEVLGADILGELARLLQQFVEFHDMVGAHWKQPTESLKRVIRQLRLRADTL